MFNWLIADGALGGVENNFFEKKTETADVVAANYD
jgi:hypothetical protein